MNIHEINPYIRHAAPSRIHPPLHINRRIILDYELLYVESGEFILQYDDINYTCTSGDILLICPNVPHSFHILTQTLSQPNIHFDFSYDSLSDKLYISYQDLDSIPPAHRSLIRANIFPNSSTLPFLRISDREAFLKDFYEILSANDIHSLSCKITFLRMLQMILAENQATISGSAYSSNNTIQHVKAYLDANYQHKISLSSLEQLFGYSKYYLERMFQKSYNESIIHYYNRKRMESAPLLLKDNTVTDVAQMLGFSSVYAFSRAYRSYYGVSPTQHKTGRNAQP